jgi:hypothetical protein
VRAVRDSESGSEAVASFPSPDVRFTDQSAAIDLSCAAVRRLSARLQWNS